MNLKIFCLSAAALIVLCSQAHADDAQPFPGTISGTVSGITDYRFRGISQTREDPAVQAGVEWNHPDGFKLGVWGSNVDFGTSGGGSLETDVYGSYTWKLAPGATLETGLYGYLYPGSSSNLDYDYGEGYANLAYTYDVVTLTGSFYYSPDDFGGSGNSYYPQIAASIALPHDFTLDGAVGRQWVEDNAVFGVPDYTTWNAGIAYTWQGFTGKLQYVDTSLSTAECASGCDAAAIFSITKKF